MCEYALLKPGLGDPSPVGGKAGDAVPNISAVTACETQCKKKFETLSTLVPSTDGDFLNELLRMNGL